MKVILNKDTSIYSIHGTIDIIKTEVYTVSVHEEDDPESAFGGSHTLRLDSETDHWWIERGEFKKAIADGTILIVNENR